MHGLARILVPSYGSINGDEGTLHFYALATKVLSYVARVRK